MTQTSLFENECNFDQCEACQDEPHCPNVGVCSAPSNCGMEYWGDGISGCNVCGKTDDSGIGDWGNN